MPQIDFATVCRLDAYMENHDVRTPAGGTAKNSRGNTLEQTFDRTRKSLVKQRAPQRK
jgi:hypothetical protein